MRYLPSLACWFFLFCISISSGAAEDQDDCTGTFEVDLVFPRNKTYNPSPMMPIIFSYRNPKLISLLQPSIIYQIWDYDNMRKTVAGAEIEAPSVNLSTSGDPHFEHLFSREFNREGRWFLTVHFFWQNCFEDPDHQSSVGSHGNNIQLNDTAASFIFTTKGSSKQVDLVAATRDKNCSSPAGAAIKVQGKLRTPKYKGYDKEFCPVTPTATEADECAVTMPASAASSINAAMTSWPN
ncbi:uncharacterized protein BKA55DRAFT_735098 [Fusarium redolens]|uniref:DUF7136 domain-containing protein n=1 Tax=Fusarium redolens TaxID=48865 RepID=A0A9P9HPP5_FUSRE|nr:uncharacterized protein BKA55DRAFT_735098 [Fusarium redolens]KAH7260828.1 hypothetical protein BKA55DRAFT_735098 [Fusarium redolens]